MSETLVFVTLAAIALAVFAYLAAHRKTQVQGIEQAFHTIRALDIEAFRNLVDPSEEEFLRTQLPAREFRRIRRARVRAARAYVKEVSTAAWQLASFGDTAQYHPDPAIAASGKQIANSATTLRLRALQTSANLMIAAAFPGMGPRPVHALLDQYDRAAQLLRRHNGLEGTQGQAS